MPKLATGAVVNHKSNGYSWTVEHVDANGLVLCTTVLKDGAVVQMRFHSGNLTIEDPARKDNDLVTEYNNSLP